jgi:hypothetical protein
MVMKKANGEKFDVKGKLFDEIRVEMVVDGYNAPLTGWWRPDHPCWAPERC